MEPFVDGIDGNIYMWDVKQCTTIQPCSYLSIDTVYSFFWSAINWKLWYKSSIRLYYGDVSEWVKNSRMGRKTPNNQTNLEFIQWIKVIRFLFPQCELSRVLFPVWKEQTIKAPGTGELKTQLSPLGKRDWPKQSFVLCFNNICHVVQ